jgi:hypothetical protein
MNRAQRQVIAEKVSSTVRVLELLQLDYSVLRPERKKDKRNRSPRVVRVDAGKLRGVRIYNSYKGGTWANERGGKPIPQVKSVEDLYDYLKARLMGRAR